MSSESVKVCDRELKLLAELAAQWDDIDAVLGRYVSIMKKVQEEAVKSGNVHSAVLDLYCFSSRFHELAKGLGKEASTHITKLASKIEAIDLNLYNA